MDITACFLSFCAFLLSLEKVYGLECYVCSNQDSNKDKCIKTTKQCEQEEDVCMTWVRWGIPPYWTPHGDRRYYIDKDCSRTKICGAKRENTMSFCKRDWYADWGCYECCSGDLCNYYVTLAGSTVQARLTVLLMGITAVFYTWKITST